MNSKEHSDLEEWARTFGGTAILGFISTLLLGGKLLHHVLSMRGLVFGYLIIPPAILSGVLGLVWFSVIEHFDPLMTADLRSGLEALKGNLINFVFGALILGLTSITCSRKNSHHNMSLRGMLTSIFHEGMPMMFYSQILAWGQTTCCLLVTCIYNLFSRSAIPFAFPTLVPLGLEAGNDVVLSSAQRNEFSAVVIEEAESLGLVAVCVMGILLFTLKPYFIARGLLGKSYIRDQQHSSFSSSSTGQAETFQRGGKTKGMGMGSLGRIWSQDDLSTILEGGSTGGYMEDTGGGQSYIDKDDDSKYTMAGLGAHMSLIALNAFVSFALSLLLHLVEIEMGIQYHWLSGVRMFKFAMCSAMFSMLFIVTRTKIKFNREWFLRICGLLLDLLFIASLAKAYPRVLALGQSHYIMCSLFVLVCVLWNAFCFVYVAQRLFPNYWYERAITLMGDCLGHSCTGLVFVRTLDHQMESPVPLAYAYKLLLFFIPSTGTKQTIIAHVMESHSPWLAFLICLCVMFTWLFIFDTYFRSRYVEIKKASSKTTLPLSDDDAEDNQDGATTRLLDSSLTKDGSVPVLISGLKSTQRKSLRRTSSAVSSGEIGSNATIEDPALYMAEDIPVSVITVIQTNESSSIINQQQMRIVAGFLSDIDAVKSWKLTYSLRQHGASLSTLLACTAKKSRGGSVLHVPCVIIIEDSWGYIFGGFISPGMQNKSAYYGNGESFVFSIEPTAQVHRWTGRNELFVLSNEHCFAMGGGGDGFAIQLDDELDTGVSSRSDTYDNHLLSSSEFFKCLNVEVWTLDMTGYSV